MNDLISQEFEKLESNKAKIIEIVELYSKEDRLKSLPGKWSMIQVLRHIQVSEDGSMTYMMKKSKAGDQMKSRPLFTRFLLQILYLTFRLRFKFKAPKIVSDPQISSLTEVEKDWNETRKKLREFLENYPGEWMGKAVYRHPVIGMLNMTDGLQFINAHLKHHMNQVRRIERQIMTLDAGDNKEITSK